MKKCINIKMNALISTLGLVLGLSAGVVFAQQNMIINGSFEAGGSGNGNFPEWDWIGWADNNSDYGVTPSGVAPEVAEQGNYYAYFHGNPTDGSQDCLGQTVNVVVGAQ